MSKTFKSDAAKDDLNNLILKYDEAIAKQTTEPLKNSFFYNGTLEETKE